MGYHEFKFDRQSKTIINSKIVEMNVYKCIYCGQLYLQDVKTGKKITVNGKMGAEV
ncbi:MAG: hypothetical protein ACTSXT_08115 [Candidatus Helarchaeota archaeon]